MGVNSLPKTVTRQHRGCNLNVGPSAPESSTLTTRLLSQPALGMVVIVLSTVAGWASSFAGRPCQHYGHGRRHGVAALSIVQQ